MTTTLRAAHTRGQLGELCFRRANDFTRDTAERLELRASADDVPTFEGWACRYGVVDSYGTTFVEGCFREQLDGTYPLLWMHDPHEPVGTFRAEERDGGLWLAGTYDSTDVGQRARARALAGSAPELSVGFVWYASDPDDEDRITGAKLVETSQITLRMASVPGSQIEAVRELAAAQLDEGADEAAVRARLVIAQLGLAAVDTRRPWDDGMGA